MIRTARLSDFEVLCNLEKHITPDTLKKKIQDKEILVYVEDEIIIGWLRYNFFWDIYPFMGMLYVIEEHRGKGLGIKLVSYWEETMSKAGFDLVMTSTLSNEKAQHFYRKIGYTDIGGFVLPHEPLEIIMVKKWYA